MEYVIESLGHQYIAYLYFKAAVQFGGLTLFILSLMGLIAYVVKKASE